MATEDDVKAQGDLVRKLKSEKADKATIAAAVQKLLALKNELAASTGAAPIPAGKQTKAQKKAAKNAAAPAAAKPAAAAAAAAAAPASGVEAEIAAQALVVRQLKADKADKETITAAVQKLLALKAQGGVATGSNNKKEKKSATAPAPKKKESAPAPARKAPPAKAAAAPKPASAAPAAKPVALTGTMASFAEFAARAADAEKRISELTDHLCDLQEQLEEGSGSVGGGVGEFKEYFLAKLQDTRSIIAAESADYEQCKADKARLEAENAKLKYRILHLMRSLEAEEQRK